MPAAFPALLADAAAAAKRVGPVELEQDVLAVVDIPCNDAGYILLNPAAEAIVAVSRRGEIGEGDLDQSVLGVVGIARDGDAQLLGHYRLRTDMLYI